MQTSDIIQNVMAADYHQFKKPTALVHFTIMLHGSVTSQPISNLHSVFFTKTLSGPDLLSNFPFPESQRFIVEFVYNSAAILKNTEMYGASMVG